MQLRHLGRPAPTSRPRLSAFTLISASLATATAFCGVPKPSSAALGARSHLSSVLKHSHRAFAASGSQRGLRGGSGVFVAMSGDKVPVGGGEIDEKKYEEERLNKDQEAMKQMQQVMEKATDPAMEGFDNLRNPWKWAIRKRVWDFMEANNIARNPRPVHHRIPNFEGAELAAANLCSLPEFQSAKVVKVNPDTPQKEVRFGVLSGGKTLMAPQPRLRTGFFSTLTQEEVPEGKVREACTSLGMAKFGSPIDLEAKITVDLVVVGSTAVCPKTGARIGKGEGFAELLSHVCSLIHPYAVCPKTGARIGKGEGFAELEYGMLRWMGSISDKTLVVTTVNDCQIVDDIPSGELMKHDVSVDVICTPTRIIRVEKPVPKPSGIYWDLLSPEKLSQVRVLQKLKRIIEAQTGEKLPTGCGQWL